ncbi:alpha amylase family protein [Ornithinibacillus salinisoli]|uniref:Alpha amylase family protein n=1 Tax=Ornithinibacillus salinisoli TaxID=1848459 RepID=A0ABW4VY10_9BACI
MSFTFNENANILWVDFLANGVRLANENEQLKLLENAVHTGITHLIIDAKVPFGQTTYPSNYGYHISSWSDDRFIMWEDRDFLDEFLTKAKKYDVKVLANMDVFSEGTTASKDGIAYDKEDWKVTFYNDAVSSESNAAEYKDADTIFVNPIHPKVEAHELNILKEICMYDLDGVVVDRCRYPNVYGDFNELSRKGFERYIGETIENWPEDIFTINEEKAIEFGKLFPKWTEWRANNIKTFVTKARAIVKDHVPLFADYVGSWYPLYYSEGVNWGSESFKPNLAWTSDTYHVSGLAEQLDFLMTGCYYYEVTKEEADKNGRPDYWYSVEGAADISLDVVNGSIPFVASLFLKNYQGDPEQFRKAIRMCKEKSAGVMLFDTVYVEEYNWWDILKEELK